MQDSRVCEAASEFVACQETDRLVALTRALAEAAASFAPQATRLIDVFRERSQALRDGAELDRLLEGYVRLLRCRWLQFCAWGPSAVYRSPTEEQQRSLEANPLLESFGYERDLQPTLLEQRCAQFFPPAPASWAGGHLLFSSGQAAMNVALTALRQSLHSRPLRVVHLGGYFETALLLAAQPASFEILGADEYADADCLVVEPVFCNGQFGSVEAKRLAEVLDRARDCRFVLFDTTLVGRNDGVQRLLAKLPSARNITVLRVCSGLKLFQQGFELANVGILSCYERHTGQRRDVAALAALRELRTLTGSGLRLADAVALEAPWVFDARATDDYEQAVFAHNARLVREAAAANRLFAPLSHPALTGGNAPYCTFMLREASAAAYERLEAHIAEEVQRRDIVVDHGGSFGFRGHRYEVVRPDTGDPPFLRVAMGCRGGFSGDALVTLMVDTASLSSLPA